MLQLFLCCNTHPRQISCDLGSDYLINLYQYLQPLGIRLTSDGTGVKSTTSVAELSIRLLKTCLRQASLHDPRMWPQYLPQCVQVINSLPLYDTKISRNLLYYNPNIYQSLVYTQFARQGVNYLEQEKKTSAAHSKEKRFASEKFNSISA